MTTNPGEKWFIGQRVVDEEGHRATVRYIGPVATSKDPEAIWIGVEWDYDSRGKHDGSVVKSDGTTVRHFTCHKPGPTNASFLKPNKLDRGVGCMEVLHKRYVAMDAPLEAPNQVFEGAYANTNRGGQKVIEFHGEEKIRKHQQLNVLEKVSMRGERVAWAGEASVEEEAAHLVEVDVQGNLWSSWEELGHLARQMPKLEILHLNSNLMMPLSSPPSPTLASSCPALRVLILNHCGIDSWLTVQYLETCLPALQELGLARNDLADVEDICQGEPITTGFQHLQSLDLSATGLRRWSQVALFAKLPDLRLLSLNENQLETIERPNAADSEGDAASSNNNNNIINDNNHNNNSNSSSFQRLEALHLSGNQIGSWSSIDALNGFPALHALRFTNNSVTRGMGQSEARQLLVARVASLTRVNGAEVSKRERVEAEKSYVRRVAREVGKVGEESGREEILSQHPRWSGLLEVHGDGGGLSSHSQGTGSLAKEMLSVRLVSMASGSMTMAPVEKKIPGSLTVGLLKQLMQKLFRLEQSLQVLYYKVEKDAPPTMLDLDDETLTYFGVTSGCEMYMNERDLKAEAREEETKRREEKERLGEQMKQIDLLDSLKRANVGMHTQSAQLAAASK